MDYILQGGEKALASGKRNGIRKKASQLPGDFLGSIYRVKKTGGEMKIREGKPNRQSWTRGHVCDRYGR